MKDVIISPSILNCDYMHLENEVNKIISSGGKWIHLDVMDGKFVPNISVGNIFFDKISPNINLVKDVHIMVSEPILYVEKFAKAGANYLTFHFETCENEDEIKKIISLIKANHMKVGISLKPDTPVEKIFPFLKYIDLVLIMSVMPGKGGQSFMKDALLRIKQIKSEIVKQKANVLISVDGGINDIVAHQCVESGADILVVGSYLFLSQDFAERFQKLK